METAIYKFADEKWTETKRITRKDIALIIDIMNKTIYIWEGPLSSARNQTLAKNMLGKIKKQYPNYKFRTAENLDSSETKKIVDEALQDTEEFARRNEHNSNQLEIVQRMLGLIIATGTIILLIILISLFASESNVNSNQQVVYYIARTDMFSFFYLMGLVQFLLSILMGISIVIAITQKRKGRIIGYSIAAILTVFMIFGYWNPQIQQFLLFEDITQPEMLIIPYNMVFQFLLNSNIIMGIDLICIIASVYNRYKEPITK